MRSLGLDLGATNIKWVVLEDGRVSTDGRTETQAAEGPEAVLGRLLEVAREAGPVDTIGIGIPGLFDDSTGTLTMLPNLPGDWQDRPLAAPFAAALETPVRLVNDARAFALAEWALGAARGCDTAAFFVVGTGVGGGIVVRGAPHEGREGRAGELGHLTIDPEGPTCTCGNRGCVEAFVREAVEAGDVERAGRYLGIGIGNAIVVLAPDRVVVGGGVATAGEALLAPARAEVEKRVTVSVPVEIVPAQLGVLAGAIGAALRGALWAEQSWAPPKRAR